MRCRKFLTQRGKIERHCRSLSDPSVLQKPEKNGINFGWMCKWQRPWNPYKKGSLECTEPVCNTVFHRLHIRIFWVATFNMELNHTRSVPQWGWRKELSSFIINCAPVRYVKTCRDVMGITQLTARVKDFCKRIAVVQCFATNKCTQNDTFRSNFLMRHS